MSISFQVAANDQSIYYLSQIFGYVGNLFNIPAAGQAGSAPSQILGAMFKTFNTIVLSVGVLIVVYVTVVGLLVTAHEGEFMGKKYHQLWTPVRMVLGIAALIPSASGYSFLQIIMMWVIIQGIAAADVMWTTVLNYVNTFGSTTAGVSIDNINVSNQIPKLFQSLVCQASSSLTTKLPESSGSVYYCAQNNCTTPIQPFDPNATQYNMGPNGTNYCGTLTYCGNNPPTCNASTTDISAQLGCAACKAQTEALELIIPTLSQIAEKFAATDSEYMLFYNGIIPAPAWVKAFCVQGGIPEASCCRPIPGGTSCPNPSPSLPDPGNSYSVPNDTAKELYWSFVIGPLVGNTDFIQSSISQYSTTLQTAVTNILLQQQQQQVTYQAGGTNSDMQKMQQYGWIFAGAFYYIIASGNNKNQSSASPTLSISVVGTQPDGPGGAGGDNPLFSNNNRSNWSAASALVQSASAATQPSAAPVNPNLSDLDSLATVGKDTLYQNFMNTVTGAKVGETPINPLIAVQSLGERLLITVIAFYLAVLILLIGLGLLGNLAFFAVGTGATNPGGGTAILIYMFLIPVLFGFITLFFSFGGLLAVYTPLIPFVVFTMGAIGWFISTIEAMVAAPLVALGILAPSTQHHEILGKAEPALMLIFGIFLRPTLMIFGLVAASLLVNVVIMMINAGFAVIVGTLADTGVAKAAKGNLLEIILFIGAYVYLILAAINKCFTLIHVIPDRTLVWISGQPGGAGGEAEEGLKAAKGGVESAGGGLSGTMAGAKEKTEATGAKRMPKKEAGVSG